MANTYRNKVVNLTNNGLTSIYTCPSNTVALVMKINAANISGNDTNIGVAVTDTSASVTGYLCKTTVLPANSSLKVGDEEPVVLEASDVLKAIAGTASAVDIFLSILEIS